MGTECLSIYEHALLEDILQNAYKEAKTDFDQDMILRILNLVSGADFIHLKTVE